MIRFDEKNLVFKLDTPHTSYLVGLADQSYLGHIYYGRKISDTDLAFLFRTEESPQPPSVLLREKTAFLDFFPMEYPFAGTGDQRECCINIRMEDGQEGLELTYRSHRIFRGKRELPGLPATWGEETLSAPLRSALNEHPLDVQRPPCGQRISRPEDEDATRRGQDAPPLETLRVGGADSLEIELADDVTGLTVVLSYTVFDDSDALVRSVRVRNDGEHSLFLTRVLSACIHVEMEEAEMLTIPGSWARERHPQRQEIRYGGYTAESRRGISSHQANPFVAVLSRDCTQTGGEVYAMNFVYSGNFLAKVEKDQFDQIRMVMGIHPDHFCWKLAPGEEFQAPEVVLVYSDEGLGKMTRTFHDLYRTHMIRGYWKDRERPVLINNWEATYFDFDTEKLLAIARDAAASGIEMLVVDDGWFGHRDRDDSSLGDWVVNEEKLPGGFQYLAEEVNRLGMKLGIWMEPEMVSEDSELYRAHPDWALQLKERIPGQCRAQYVLDLSRKEVRDFIYEQIYKVLSSANIEYVKWDMNRPLADVGNAVLSAQRQGEISHRYMLGVYEMQERLRKDFPTLLLENCCSGGGRFDPGMLYYSPQIWCSDDTDAAERLAIQEGTALIYPLSAIGAHVSACPNHQTGRNIPFSTRGIVALSGTFGYELDITRLSPEEKGQIPGQVAMYRQYSHLIREGDYYRLASWKQNGSLDSYMIVSKDKSEALVICVQVLAAPNRKSRRLRLQGLDPERYYAVETPPSFDRGQNTPPSETLCEGNAVGERIYQGATLLYAGLLIQPENGDFQARVLYIRG